MRISKVWGVLGVCAGLAACSLSPSVVDDQKIPQQGYHMAEVSTNSQTLQWGQDPAQAWWKAFASPALDQEVELALKNNPGLDAQRYALQQQQELYGATRGSLLFPSVSANASANREKIFLGPGLIFGPLNLYNAGINVSYGLDLFGASRNTLKAALAQVDSERYSLMASRQMLVANVLTANFSAAYAQSVITTTQQILKDQEQQLEIMKARRASGALSDADVAAQELVVDNTRASLPELEKSRVQAEHQVNALLGRSPDDPLQNLDLSAIPMPDHLPVSLPSTVAKQRPDVEAAEALWRAAAAQVGVASANLYPQIRLTADYSSYAVTPSKLFAANSMVWGLGAGLTAPIFDGGALRAEKRASEQAFNAAGATYRQTIIKAFQNVADALTALQQDEATEMARKQAAQAADISLQLTQQSYDVGAQPLANVLLAEQQVENAHLASVAAHAARLADCVALYQALGGRWDQIESENQAKKGVKP